MDERKAIEYIEGNNEEKMQEAFVFLATSGNLKHLRPILTRMKTLPNGHLKKAAISTASGILKRNLFDNYDAMDKKTRKSLSTILKTIDSSIVNSIARDLQSNDEQLRFKAIRVLGHLGQDDKIKEILKKILRDRSGKIRATAVSLLRQMIGFNDYDSIVLSKLLNDKNDRVVANTIEAISEINEKCLLSLIIRFKSHRNNRIRGNTLKALWKTGKQNVFSNLVKMIHDKKNALMRATACWVIGECAKKDNKYYIKLLSECIKDPEESVRQNAIKALLKIGGHTADAILNKDGDSKEIAEIKSTL